MHRVHYNAVLIVGMRVRRTVRLCKKIAKSSRKRTQSHSSRMLELVPSAGGGLWDYSKGQSLPLSLAQLRKSAVLAVCAKVRLEILPNVPSQNGMATSPQCVVQDFTNSQELTKKAHLNIYAEYKDLIP
jgi:hypothetical protein